MGKKQGMTAKEIQQAMTKNGGWDRETLESWGIPWPPPKGWKKLLLEEGMQTSDSKKVKNLAKQKAKRKKRKDKRNAKKGHSALGFPHIKRTHRPGKWVSKEEYDRFYLSRAWRELRYLALKNTDGRCECCGISKDDGAVLHVDHIKPRYARPDLQLSLSNVQVLCADCNIGKGAWDDTDWRSDAAKHMDDITKH